MDFKSYKRLSKLELRPVNESDISFFGKTGYLLSHHGDIANMSRISISEEDLKAGSPKLGDTVLSAVLIVNNKI